MTIEPFVSAEEAAQFLAITRRHLLALARQGITGAYAVGSGMKRKTWVFRLSELAKAIATREVINRLPRLTASTSAGSR